MSLIAVIGASLQLALLLFTKWFQLRDEKKEERKVLREEAIQAIKDGDASRITIIFDAINRM